MMQYRQAKYTDHELIAHLHADSWRRTYRGLFTDAFLEHEADADRVRVWAQRLKTPAANQAVFVAEANGVIQGFICLYGGDDPQWGSLIDNLHILHGEKRQGLGRNLMTRAFDWLMDGYAGSSVYLWVMENNQAARCFYEKLGADNAGVIDKPNPVGGGSARNCRYVWDSPLQLRSTLAKFRAS